MGQEISNRIVIRSEDLVQVREVNSNTAIPAKTEFTSNERPHSRHSRPMLWVLFFATTVLAGALLVGLISWQTPPGKRSIAPEELSKNVQRKAIDRVLQADHLISSETVKAQTPKAPPSQFAHAIRDYCARASSQSFSDCPPEFVLAYRHHLRAWRNECDALANLPDSFLEGIFLATVNTFLHGELDGGERRLTSEVRNAVLRVRSTWEEVERIAAKYSVIAPE